MQRTNEPDTSLKKILFKEFELQLRPLKLLKEGVPVETPLKSLRLIALLAGREGGLVTHDEIHDELWDGRAMDVQRNTHVCIHQARAAIDAQGAKASLIENVPGQGYRLIAPVSLIAEKPLGHFPPGLSLGGWKQNWMGSWSASLPTLRLILFAILLGPAVMFAAPRESADAESGNVTFAQNAFEEGVILANRDDPDSLRRAIAYFDTAIDADENFADAHIEASMSYWRLGQFGNAAMHARNALKINDGLSDAYTLLGLVNLMHEWEWDSAHQNLARGISRNPDSADAHHGLGTYYVIHGDFESGKNHLRQSYELSGGSDIAETHLGWAHFYAGDFDKAIAACGANLHVDETRTEKRRCYIQALFGAHRYDEAREQIDTFMIEAKARQSDVVSVLNSANNDLMKAFDGWRFRQLSQAKGKFPQSSAQLAFAAAGAGNYDRALFYANLAINERCSMIPFVAVDPVFRPMFDDPDFQSILGKLRLR